MSRKQTTNNKQGLERTMHRFRNTCSLGLLPDVWARSLSRALIGWIAGFEGSFIVSIRIHHRHHHHHVAHHPQSWRWWIGWLGCSTDLIDEPCVWQR